MNKIDEILNELREEHLLDAVDYNPFEKSYNSGISAFSQSELFSNFQTEATNYSGNLAEPAIAPPQIRYSVANLNNLDSPYSTQKRIKIIKRDAAFSRPCKCCSANVFILDAYCHNCNERMISNFFFYSFFVFCGLLIGFMIFYMAISNPF